MSDFDVSCSADNEMQKICVGRFENIITKNEGDLHVPKTKVEYMRPRDR